MVRALNSSGVISRIKRPILLGLLVGLVTAVATLFLPNQYRSEGRILPMESKSLGGNIGNLGNLAAAATAFGVSVPSGEGSSDANAVDILTSRWLRERLLQTEFHFHARTWRFGTEGVRKETLYSHLEARNLDRALKKFSTMYGASKDQKSRVVSLYMESISPELSQQVVKRALQLLEEFVQQKGRTRGGAKATFAEARLKEAREETAQAEDELRHFLNGNRNYITSSDPSVRLRGMRLEAELKLRQQLVTTLALNREQALMEEKNDIPILNILDSGNLPIEKSRPARSSIVLLTALLVGVTSWTWFNRKWIRGRLLADDPESQVKTAEKE